MCFLAFGFGTGLSPVMPGTVGTLTAFPLAFLLLKLGISRSLCVFLCLLLFWAGIGICNKAERALGLEDYGGIVWDEIVAMLMLLVWVPFSVGWWVAAFVTFRFFDMVKPWPIRWFDRRVHGGFGIMLDDVIAAGFSILVLYAVRMFLPV